MRRNRSAIYVGCICFVFIYMNQPSSDIPDCALEMADYATPASDCYHFTEEEMMMNLGGTEDWPTGDLDTFNIMTPCHAPIYYMTDNNKVKTPLISR